MKKNPRYDARDHAEEIAVVAQNFRRYVADRRARRDMEADPDRRHAAAELRRQLGKRRQLFTVSHGFNRRCGGPKAVTCLVPERRRGVANVSADVADVLGLKWDDGAVDCNNPYDLTRRLAFLLYGDAKAVTNVPL